MRARLLSLVLVASFVGCMRSSPAEMMETAKLEELQHNVPHARELYQRVITDHPDSPEAKQARERLAALEASPTGG